MNSKYGILCAKMEMKWKQQEKEMFFFVLSGITWAYEHTIREEKNIGVDYISTVECSLQLPWIHRIYEDIYYNDIILLLTVVMTN